MATVIVALTGYSSNVDNIFWSDNVSLGSTFDLDGQGQTLDRLIFTTSTHNTPGFVNIELLSVDNRFTAAFEATGRIIFTASDGLTVEVMIANADMSEPYAWMPTNSAEVAVFADHVRGLTDHDSTMTLTDDPPFIGFINVGGAAKVANPPVVNVGGVEKTVIGILENVGGTAKKIL